MENSYEFEVDTHQTCAHNVAAKTDDREGYFVVFKFTFREMQESPSIRLGT